MKKCKSCGSGNLVDGDIGSEKVLVCVDCGVEFKK